MADERLRTKRELKRLFTNLKRKGISDDMISILIDTLWRDRANLRTSGFFHAGAYDAVFSFDVNTRIFSIIPFDPLVEGFEPRYSIFSWSNRAVHHRIFTPLEIEIPNEEGLFCVYFDKEPDPGTTQVLAFKKNPTPQELEVIYTSKVLISCFYWDEENKELLHFGNDKHGSEWNPQLHWYHHTTQGAQRKSGLQFAGYSLNGDGSSNDHAKFNINGGVMLHDDFEMTIPTSSNSIPILYRFGSLPRYLANAGYAFTGSSRVYFNSGQISLAQADSGNYILYHIFATNEILTTSRKIISVMGIEQYTTLADAYQGVKPELDSIVTYMPQQGRCYLGSVIVQTSDDYANDVKARIVALTGNETHPPVSIAPGSDFYLSVNEKQQLAIDVNALPGGTGGDDGREVELQENAGWLEWRYVNDVVWTQLYLIPEGGSSTSYVWNLLGQNYTKMGEPTNILITSNGSGTVNQSFDAGLLRVTALNDRGETLASDGPAFDLLSDSTEVIVSWDAVAEATLYRVYFFGDYYETALTSIDIFGIDPDAAGDPPEVNTATVDSFLPEPYNVQVNPDGSGSQDGYNAEGSFVVTAINGFGETLPTNVPAFYTFEGSTIVPISWDAIDGATKYRVYDLSYEVGGQYFYEETTSTIVDIWSANFGALGNPPVENTAYYIPTIEITVENQDVVDFQGVGVNVEEYVDSSDPTKKIVKITKQQSSWSETNPSSPNFIPGKPETFSGTIETDMSVIGDGSVETPVILDGDEAAPGNLKYYGTNNLGAKGFHAFPVVWLVDKDFEFCVVGGIAQTETLDLYASSNFTIDKLIAECDGTLTSVTIKIGANAVTGINAVSVSTLAVFTATAVNSVVAGDRITIEIGSGFSGTPAILKGKLTIKT